MRLSSLALVTLLFLAGCMGSGGNGETADPANGDDQPAHMPRQALFSGMILLDNQSDKNWFDSYGMTENPGSANPDSFSTGSGLVPQTAYVALYAAGGDRTHAVLYEHKGEWKRLTAREAPRLLAWWPISSSITRAGIPASSSQVA